MIKSNVMKRSPVSSGKAFTVLGVTLGSLIHSGLSFVGGGNSQQMALAARHS